ncbi:MAG: hypothetical protein JWP12_1537 [Bacteroidetes bacterium]|nr:hypothetical protein [Bacteroidota bacterium]
MSRKKSYLQIKTKIYRYVAVYLAINILFQIISPTVALALTGGPSQPEVQSFEPVGTSDMVDPFSGDFNYNIPLMDVDGYPINIAYHSGITMDQEATWVGLGWNINPGVINRGMRGLPDDFDGDDVVKEINMKPNRTYGLNGGVGAEFFGAFGVDIGMGIRYNNYNGVSMENSVNLSLSSGESSKGTGTLGLGITSSSDEGLTLNPSVSFSAKVSKNESASTTSLGASIGTSFNSRCGLKTLTINTSVSAGINNGYTHKNKKDEDVNDKTSYGGSTSSTFNFGMPTYTPMAGPSMRNFSITGNFKLGSEIYPIHPHFTVGGYYSSQELTTKEIHSPAYGYMNADEGTKYDNSLMDFNREKEGSFTPHTPTLPLTNFSYDIYSVSGQGVGGSYRPFRSDMGQVFDPATNTTSTGISTGFEIGIGNLTHFGFDLSVTDVQTKTGRWSADNRAGDRLVHRATSPDPLYEKYYFKEANEKTVDSDPDFYNTKAGGANPRSAKINPLSKFHAIADHYYTEGGDIPADNYRTKRDKRNQTITTLSRGELDQFGLQSISGLLAVGTGRAQAKNHHIAEITTLRTDGARYVYGIAAYNTDQQEVTFATGTTLDGSHTARTADANKGLVDYVHTSDNSIGNTMGLDNYYSNTKMPAFAHSYMLTAVLSPDYVDSENNGTTTKGPSAGDIGNYTKFNYEPIEGYQWRIPVEQDKATYNEGLKSDPKDDKANYMYGKKQLWYLKSIETKNYIAIFTTENRRDAYGVVDNNGGIDATASGKMKRLTKISLYVKREYDAHPTTAVPVKEVHFEYDYSLCPHVPNNVDESPTATTNTGKLTLKKIYFTYQNSNKARLSPYEFTYSTFNPDYNIKGYDRWGNYKPNTVTDFNPLNPDLPTAEFPYVDQNQTTADQYSQAWSLTNIDLPSGGKIQVDYESDDYAYVQNKQAMQMFKVVDVQNNTHDFYSTTVSLPSAGTPENINFTDGTCLIVKLQSTLTGTTLEKANAFKQQYLGGLNMENFQNLYFRFLMDIKGGRYEYVSGYIQAQNIDLANVYVDPSGVYACIPVNNVQTNDSGGDHVCPITKAAIQFGRLNMSRTVWNAADLDASIGDHGSFGKSLLEAIVNADFVRNIGDAISGPNQSLYAKYLVGLNAVMGKSWIRLNSPEKKKLGGGVRVKKIQISDEWHGMSDNTDNTFTYGQEYTYTLDDGTSSGVAAYEPQLGGDENPFKQPVFFEEKNLLAPDDEHYVEEPFGESFFPSPNVGYSRVTVKNLQYENVTHHATGKVVHEFYTAKDYPTITGRTDMNTQHDKTSPVSISALLKIDVKDYMTATQGYVIELNDMHGKPKGQEVYPEGNDKAITSIEYTYRSNPWLNGSSRLDNTETVINSDGTQTSADIGVFFDLVSDSREQKTSTISGSINGNIDGFLVAAYPLYVPIIIPQFARERTQFRSFVITKLIQRFGILEQTVAKDLGSVVSTKNLAYDAETGEVLVTQTTTDYNDAVYSMKYPAHWYYDGMGPAYRNIGFFKKNVAFSSLGVATITNAPTYFAEGDELELSDGTMGWVLEVNPNEIHVIKRNGDNVTGTLDVKVLRSGRRNQQEAPMASITTLSNPLTHFKANVYDNVLQAQAMEYTNSWKTFCDCFTGTAAYTTNPYILGTKGMYKNKKSYLYLAGRSQSYYDNNTNIRKDGVFTAYTPFYKLNSASKWQIDPGNWTFTSEVTQFSPFGAELENKDALGRYSAATYGYNQTFPVAVAANSKYRNVGYDNFEDYDFSVCADNHFKFRNNSANIVSTDAHSGSRSIKVAHGTPVNMNKQLAQCDTIPPCHIAFTGMTYNDETNQYCMSITGGTAPYIIDWTEGDCDLAVTISDTGDGLCITAPDKSTCKITITVTDKNKCSKTQFYKLSPP